MKKYSIYRFIWDGDTIYFLHVMTFNGTMAYFLLFNKKVFLGFFFVFLLGCCFILLHIYISFTTTTLFLLDDVYIEWVCLLLAHGKYSLPAFEFLLCSFQESSGFTCILVATLNSKSDNLNILWYDMLHAPT